MNLVLQETGEALDLAEQIIDPCEDNHHFWRKGRNHNICVQEQREDTSLCGHDLAKKVYIKAINKLEKLGVSSSRSGKLRILVHSIASSLLNLDRSVCDVAVKLENGDFDSDRDSQHSNYLPCSSCSALNVNMFETDTIAQQLRVGWPLIQLRQLLRNIFLQFNNIEKELDRKDLIKKVEKQVDSFLEAIPLAMPRVVRRDYERALEFFIEDRAA